MPKITKRLFPYEARYGLLFIPPELRHLFPASGQDVTIIDADHEKFAGKMHKQHSRIDGLTKLHRKHNSQSVTIEVGSNEPATAHVRFEDTRIDLSKPVPTGIAFEHLVSQHEVNSEYINLTDVHGKKYGSEIGASGAILTVIDDKDRRFEMKRHHGNQLTRCSEWFASNGVTPNTKILVRFEPHEIEEGRCVLHLERKPHVCEPLSPRPDWTPFAHDGKQYEIRCAFDGCTAHVRAFRDGKPANGFEYSVALPAAIALTEWPGLSAVEPLIESAKNDIVRRSWEKIGGVFGRTETRSVL